jgi:hypothetical protein
LISKDNFTGTGKVDRAKHQLLALIGRRFRNAMQVSCSDAFSPSIARALDALRQLERSMHADDNCSVTLADGKSWPVKKAD